MITSDVYIGTKICEPCLDRIIAIYVFIERIKFFKIRLNTCIQSMINHLKRIDEPISNIFIEIASNTILPKTEGDDLEIDLIDKSDADEEDYKMVVLEDEFRIEESSAESEDSRDELLKYDKLDDFLMMQDEPLVNLARHNIKTYAKKKKDNSVTEKIENVALDDRKVDERNHMSEKKMRPRGIQKHNCSICGKHFISEYYLIRHMKTHINKKVECRDCGKILGSKFSLQEHSKMSHLLNKSFYLSCVMCLRSFTDESKLVKHMELHRYYHCVICGKLLKSLQHFGSHIQRHVYKLHLTTKTRVNCSFCEKEYKTVEQLDLHVNKIHLQMKPYSCNMCDGQFYGRKNMFAHKVVHGVRSKESCEICGEVFGSRMKLVVHVRMHFGVKPYKCELCGESFHSVHKRNLHMKNLHGGRYNCKLCNSMFQFKSDLKFHVHNSHVSCL